MEKKSGDDNCPLHIGVIMDGNGRWGLAHKKLRINGHRAGMKAVRCVIETAIEAHIPYLSLFATSKENLKRPTQEVTALKTLLYQFLTAELGRLDEVGISVRVNGDISILSDKTQKLIKQAQERTKDNKVMVLQVAFAYGGQQEIVETAQKLAYAVQEGQLTPQEITMETFRKALPCSDIPDVDLLIRTGGEYRISNFLLWKLAYAELYFTTRLWPDFSADDFYQALDFYKTRHRRFGQV